MKEGFEVGRALGYKEGLSDGSKITEGTPIILSSYSEDNLILGTMAIMAVTLVSLQFISKCFSWCKRRDDLRRVAFWNAVVDNYPDKKV